MIHTHSTHCVALTLRPGADDGERELLPAATPYFVMKVGHVPLIPYHRPGDPLAADLVAQTITRYGQQGTPIRAVMLAAWGPTSGTTRPPPPWPRSKSWRKRRSSCC